MPAGYEVLLSHYRQKCKELAELKSQKKICVKCGQHPVVENTVACEGCQDYAKPVESPDDWVTQDRVPARPRMDKCWWAPPDADQSEFRWWRCFEGGSAEGKMHGLKIGYDSASVLHIRCLRNDLPPVSGLKRVNLREWCLRQYLDDHGARVLYCEQKPLGSDIWVEIKRDEHGRPYVEVAE